MFQSLYHLCSRSLDFSQCAFSYLVLRSQELDTRVEYIEFTELEGNQKAHWVQLLGPHKPPKNQTRCLRELSKYFLNSGRLGAVTTALVSLFQCPTTFSMKEPFTDIRLLCCSFMTLILFTLTNKIRICNRQDYTHLHFLSLKSVTQYCDYLAYNISNL